jgi:hypothetical protein
MIEKEEHGKRNKMREKGRGTGTKRGNEMTEKGPTMD